jgi:hypothetical protein
MASCSIQKGRTNRCASFTLTLILLLLAGAASAQDDTAKQRENIETMVQLARQSHLAQSAEWLKINLYHKSWGSYVSRVDDPTFFLSSSGKQDPQAELEATIRAAYDTSMAAKSQQPEQCRRVARYQFLSRNMKTLGFDFSPLRCELFERWKSGIARDHVTLVFASIYLNSPASMYGHTFIRFDSDKPGEYNRLNDSAVGYSVGGNMEVGFGFLISSLIGGYPGDFSMNPFYLKVREYSDLESRDLWEYQTDLSAEEIDRMLAFIWQHSFTYMDYYFFDDNCALMLLAAFEAGRPSLNLLEQSKPWLIPLDGIKILQKNGLINKKTYRPSQYSTLVWNESRTESATRAQAVALANGLQLPEVIPGRDEAEQAAILDLAMGVLEFKRNHQHVEPDATNISRFQKQLAGVRSRNQAASLYVKAAEPAASPDEGHDSFKLGIVAGRAGGADYAQFNLRGSYHDSLDPQIGYGAGASSKMFDLYLRRSEQQVKFERLDLFDVFAPSVRKDWYRPLSIKANISVRREVLNGGELSPTALRIELAAGEGYGVSENGQVFFLADGITHLATHSDLELGPVAGWVWTPSSRMRGELNAGAHWMTAGAQRNSWLYRVDAGVAHDLFDNQNNIRLNLTRQWTGNGGAEANTYTDVQLVYSHYL